MEYKSLKDTMRSGSLQKGQEHVYILVRIASTDNFFFRLCLGLPNSIVSLLVKFNTAKSLNIKTMYLYCEDTHVFHMFYTSFACFVGLGLHSN